ncbi:hypothetical protein TIFTF001_017113 [Ficus carica]|uniref:Uncharacterized protein n=1 Tax=Ficus carica TaxID=3494 RepID=A0AA88D6Q9_FICCA|nr:hypothetical protein TIFTF001_017113 [Ficus carica]
MERMQLLEDPLEQARLLNEVPEVIAYIAEVEPAMHFAEDDREELNGSPESPVGGDSLQTPNADMDSVVFSCETETRDQRKCSEGSVSQELPQQSHVPASEVRDDVLEGESHQSVLAPNRSCCKDLFPEELQQKSPADLDVSGTREQINQCKGSTSEGNQKTLKVEIVKLSDDEQDFKTEIGNAKLEDVNSSVWYFMTSHGLKGGPYRMSSLKKCFDDMDKDLNFKVWKKGQTVEEAILLEEAIRQNFPDT